MQTLNCLTGDVGFQGADLSAPESPGVARRWLGMGVAMAVPEGSEGRAVWGRGGGIEAAGVATWQAPQVARMLGVTGRRRPIAAIHEIL
jgi:hypothetical protein